VAGLAVAAGATVSDETAGAGAGLSAASDVAVVISEVSAGELATGALAAGDAVDATGVSTLGEIVATGVDSAEASVSSEVVASMPGTTVLLICGAESTLGSVGRAFCANATLGIGVGSINGAAVAAGVDSAAVGAADATIVGLFIHPRS
jgi:hypothetical protein